MGQRHPYFGAWKDQQGAVINAETLTVTLTGTATVAIIYVAASGGSAIANGQITLSEVGAFKFWVDEDNYLTTQRFRLAFTGAKFDSVTHDDVVIFPGTTASSTETFTNKIIDADNNTISNLEHGAEVDEPSSGVHGVTGSVVGTTDTQTLSAKTLITPTIANQTNMQHDHANAVGGGATLTSPTIVTPTIASFVNATHNHTNNAGGGLAASPYIKLHDLKSTGTDGGGSSTGWQKRTVIEDQDTGNNVIVSSSVIVLQAGTYDCFITMPTGRDTVLNQARLRNTTGNVNLLLGASGINNDSGTGTNYEHDLILRGRFTVAGSQNIEIQHYTSAADANTGFGTASDSGEDEIYTVAEFWKVA